MTLPAGEQATQVAFCPAGMVVTGGGSFTPPIDPAISVTSSIWGASASAPDFWSVTMSNQSAIDTIFSVSAICTTPTSVTLSTLEAAVSARQAMEE
jgi:hypothetical protein